MQVFIHLKWKVYRKVNEMIRNIVTHKLKKDVERLPLLNQFSFLLISTVKIGNKQSKKVVSTVHNNVQQYFMTSTIIYNYARRKMQ